MAFINEEDFLNNYYTLCKETEQEIENLESKLARLDNDFELVAEETNDKELIDLLNENKKLKYRINIMKRNLAESQPNSSKKPILNGHHSNLTTTSETSLTDGHMVNILGQVEEFFTLGIARACPSIPQPFPVQIQISKVADYQCNAAMSLAKILKKSPKEAGQIILDHVGTTPLISKIELSGPGFINITLNKEFICQQVSNLVLKGVTAPSTTPLKVVIDFSSPNIAKEMHVGHLRSTIIGESISRLLEFLGHNVLRINHLGDWGTQFGMLIAHLQDKFPDFITNTPPIKDLMAFYKESKLRFDEDPEFKKRAYDAVVKLQAHEPAQYKGWEQICEISLNEFDKLYKKLNITLTPRGESFYQSRMEKLVKELDEKSFLSLEEGRKVLYAEGADIPLTIVKSDGGFTYDTSDMAAIRNRIEEENGDWLIYVVDSGQGSHLRGLYAAAKKVGIWDPSKVRIDHVGFGVVLGEDKKKFKTRSGDTVKLADLLDEGVQRAEEKLKEKHRDSVLSDEEFQKAKEAVAYGCIKYSDLCHDRVRDYVFSFDRMLDFRGNTAAYLLYALTRIRSIIRNAGLSRENLIKELENKSLVLEHEKEWKLAKTLLKIPDVLLKVSQDLYIHPLCEYLYEISTVFTEFYDNCYCIEKDSSGKIIKFHYNRLLLCEATATVMEKCFDILGINTLEKM